MPGRAERRHEPGGGQRHREHDQRGHAATARGSAGQRVHRAERARRRAGRCAAAKRSACRAAARRRGRRASRSASGRLTTISGRNTRLSAAPRGSPSAGGRTSSTFVPARARFASICATDGLAAEATSTVARPGRSRRRPRGRRSRRAPARRPVAWTSKSSPISPARGAWPAAGDADGHAVRLRLVAGEHERAATSEPSWSGERARGRWGGQGHRCGSSRISTAGEYDRTPLGVISTVVEIEARPPARPEHDPRGDPRRGPRGVLRPRLRGRAAARHRRRGAGWTSRSSLPLQVQGRAVRRRARMPVRLAAADGRRAGARARSRTSRPGFLRRILEVWDDERVQPALVAIVRSAISHEPAAAALRGFVRSELLDRIAAPARHARRRRALGPLRLPAARPADVPARAARSSRWPRWRPSDGQRMAPGMQHLPHRSHWVTVHYKRVIPCMDVDAGRVVKGTRFIDIRDAGDPVELAAHYDAEGADELIFLDITATSDKRATVVELARRAADEVFVPFTDRRRRARGRRRPCRARRGRRQGGGQLRRGGAAGADRRAGAGVRRPVRGAGDRRQARRARAGRCTSRAGGRRRGSTRASGHARAPSAGAGEIMLTSMDRDGTKDGYDTELVRAISGAVEIPVIASGGVGEPHHLVDGFAAGADAVLCASIFHYGHYTDRRGQGAPHRGRRAGAAAMKRGSTLGPFGELADAALVAELAAEGRVGRLRRVLRVGPHRVHGHPRRGRSVDRPRRRSPCARSGVLLGPMVTPLAPAARSQARA